MARLVYHVFKGDMKLTVKPLPRKEARALAYKLMMGDPKKNRADCQYCLVSVDNLNRPTGDVKEIITYQHSKCVVGYYRLSMNNRNPEYLLEVYELCPNGELGGRI